jgi:hypothetical protein
MALPAPGRMARYKVTTTDTGADVLGGPVPYENAYIRAYGEPVNAGDKSPAELEIGESVLRRYRLSGSTGVYRVVRVDDAEPVAPTFPVEG